MVDLGDFVILVAVGGGGFASSVALMEKRLPPGFKLKVPSATDEDTLCASAKDADAILGVRISRRVISSAPKLRMIQVLGTGIDKVDIDAALERGVTVCNMVGDNAIEVSEHAVALILGLAKNLHKYQRSISSGKWEKHKSILLEGRTLGIVGLGSIGTEVARRAKPFGMKVIALKRHPDEALREKLGLAFLGGPDSLGYVLGASDFVLLSIVLTGETKGMIGKEQFAAMKDGAYLINIARGDVVDEDALLAALQTGKLAGAGLDVFQTEPPKPDNPLLKLENVIITPHVAGLLWDPDREVDRVDFIINNIVKGVTGGRPDNRVDPVLKYARRTTPH